MTTKNNRGSRCAEDVENLLKIRDPSATAFEIKKNVVAVFSKLESNAVFSLLLTYPPTYIIKVFPAHVVCDLNKEQIVDIAESIILSKRIRSFFVNCQNRGSPYNCREIEISIGIRMQGKVTVEFKDPDAILHINLVNNYAVLSLLPRDREKVSAYPTKPHI